MKSAAGAWAPLFNLLEPLFAWAQRRLGLSRLAWLFLVPNLVVFGLFTFLPIAINLVYATTGGVKLLPQERPFTGMENFAILLECRDYLDLQTCRLPSRPIRPAPAKQCGAPAHSPEPQSAWSAARAVRPGTGQSH